MNISSPIAKQLFLHLIIPKSNQSLAVLLLDLVTLLQATVSFLQGESYNQ